MSIVEHFYTLVQSNDTQQLQEFVQQYPSLIGEPKAMKICIQNLNIFALDLIAKPVTDIRLFDRRYSDDADNCAILKCLLKHNCIDSKQFAKYCESYCKTILGMSFICNAGVNIN